MTATINLVRIKQQSSCFLPFHVHVLSFYLCIKISRQSTTVHWRSHMAASAYASVVSLLNTLHQLQNHPLFSPSLDKKHLETLCGKASFLLDFLQRYSDRGNQEAQLLEGQITRAAYAAQDLIDSHVADHILGGSSRCSNTLFHDLQKVIGDMDSIEHKVMEIWDMTAVDDSPLPTYSEKQNAGTRRAPQIGKTTMVGFEDEQNQLIQRLTTGQKSLQVIPIVGMGGAGKTTLARSVYENSDIQLHFDVQIWVTISQNYTLRDFLLQIPVCEKEHKKSDELLQVVLHKSLYDRRYLIVMDDIWNVELLDTVKSFLPDNGNMSRIVMTTRLANVAPDDILKLNFLDEDKSWKLFCENALKEACPLELEDLGREIVRKCKGLPLAILVIGGLLAKSSQTQEYWESVAKDINSILNSDDEDHYLSVLALSYTHLSTHLKPCFLYMGIFPEDHEIHVSDLVRLWIAEGFLKPNANQSLEEVALGYLKDLVDRNLILDGRQGMKGKLKSCYIHDVLRDLSSKLAQKEEFFCVLKDYDGSTIVQGMRRTVSHGISQFPWSSSTCSHISFGEGSQFSMKDTPQMRVLNNVVVQSQEDIFQQVNLRYLSYGHDFRSISGFPSLVSRLWNLQTLKISHNEGASRFRISAPPEIWEMQELRHVDVSNLCLPDPPIHGHVEEDNVVLKKFHTLKKVVNFTSTQEVVRRIPCIKKMALDYEEIMGTEAVENCCLQNLSQFEMLVSLHIDFPADTNTGEHMLQHLRFPHSLKKITSTKVGLSWDDMTIFGALPNLEVLKFKGSGCEFKGTEWNPVEEEFITLKSLQIDNCKDLVSWNADSSHFPALVNLHLGYARNLDEIPSGFGGIETLQVISIHGCKSSTAISALKILIEQESYGNEDLNVQVSFEDFFERWKLREQMAEEGLKSDRFHFEIPRRRITRRIKAPWHDAFLANGGASRLMKAASLLSFREKDLSAHVPSKGLQGVRKTLNTLQFAVAAMSSNTFQQHMAAALNSVMSEQHRDGSETQERETLQAPVDQHESEEQSSNPSEP